MKWLKGLGAGMSHHFHPAGLRFKLQDLSGDPQARFSAQLYQNMRVNMKPDPWISWQSTNLRSQLYGRWVLLNARTGQTFVEVAKP